MSGTWDNETRGKLAPILSRVDGPEIARYLVRGFGRIPAAREDLCYWLLAFPETASIGMIPLAVGPAGADCDEAGRALRYLAANGRRDVCIEVAGRYGAAARAEVERVLAVDPIADTSKEIAVRTRANAVLDAVRVRDRLSVDELEDRIVPTLCLSPLGTIVLDFGTRSFELGLDAHLEPVVVDASGKRHAALPKPSPSDDGAKAADATAKFKSIRAEAKSLGAIQSRRLERAMVSQRRWLGAEWSRFVLQHPLMSKLARRLVWGVFDEKDTLMRAFRVAEDDTLADMDDRPMSIATTDRVGVVHRLNLGDSAVLAWQKRAAEYEVIELFPQLAREVRVLGEAEALSNELSRHAGRKLPYRKVMGLVDTNGWRPALWRPGHHQRIYRVQKALPRGFVAELSFIHGQYPGDSILQSVTLLGIGSRPKPTFGELDSVSASEILLDLESLGTT